MDEETYNEFVSADNVLRRTELADFTMYQCPMLCAAFVPSYCSCSVTTSVVPASVSIEKTFPSTAEPSAQQISAFLDQAIDGAIADATNEALADP